MRKVSKKFLTDSADENGSIVWKVETPLETIEGLHQQTDIDADIQFRACYGEPVTISFCAYTQASHKKRIKKIDTLINELVKFKEAYLEGIKESERLMKIAGSKVKSKGVN